MNRYWAILGFFCIILGHSSAFAEGGITRDMLLNASLVAGIELPNCVLTVEKSNESSEFKSVVQKFVFRAMQLRSEVRDLSHRTTPTESGMLEEVADTLGAEIHKACFQTLPAIASAEENRSGRELVTLSEPEEHLIGLRSDLLDRMDQFTFDGAIIHAYLDLGTEKSDIYALTLVTLQSLANSRNQPTGK